MIQGAGKCLVLTKGAPSTPALEDVGWLRALAAEKRRGKGRGVEGAPEGVEGFREQEVH